MLTQSEASHCLNYVDGKWKESSSGESFERENPATGEIVSNAQNSSVEDVREAVSVAKRVQEESKWGEKAADRTRALYKLAELLRANSEKMAVLLTRECGRPLSTARWELQVSAEEIEYFAGLAANVYGRTITPAPDSLAVLSREPMGVVSVIVPWNLPILLLERSLAPALATGNAAVIKPSSYAPAVTAEFVKLIDSIPEFPKGIANLITGGGKILGAELCQNPDVAMIAFTGGSEAGREIVRLSAKNFAKLDLELGGKAPAIIFDDANLEKAIAAIMAGAFVGTSGQDCVACTRVLLQSGVYDKFMQAFRRRTESLKVGNGLDETTEIGPLVSKHQMETVLNYIEYGKQEGSKLVTGGRRLTEGQLGNGYFVAPTIFEDVPTQSRIAQEEIFGPVLSFFKFEDEQEALEIANDTSYGLGSGVWTNDVNRAIRVAKGIKAGIVWVNTWFKIFPSTEFGGYKQSGIGRTRGLEGLYAFTQIKNIVFDTKPIFG